MYITKGRIVEFIPLPRVLVLYEMQIVLSKIWTQVAVSISNDASYGHLHIKEIFSVSSPLFFSLMIEMWSDMMI